MTRSFIATGDCVATLRTFPNACIDAIVSDPPYELGFMGKKWDASGIAFSVELWREALRVLKPGGHLLAFSGTRTYHRMVCAIEDAGFEIRDQLAYMYGTGFPKSKNVAMSIDKGEGMIGHRSIAAVTVGVGDCSGGRAPDRDVGAYVPNEGTPGAPWAGWGTALKPAQEPIVLARKPLIGTVAANVLQHGTGGINVDACRIGTAEKWEGRKTDSGPSIALRGGADGSLNNQSSGSHDAGRWPANVLLDEAAAAMLDEQSGVSRDGVAGKRTGQNGVGNWGYGAASESWGGFGGSGGVSRFFYTAKASRTEREAGLDHMPPHSAGELTDRTDGSDGLKSPRAGAGRTSGNGEDVEEIRVWVSEGQQAVLRVVMGRSRPRVTGASGMSDSDATAWSTLLFGSDALAPSRPAMTCTIETRTSSTTGSRILDYLQSSLTRGSTGGASSTTTGSSESRVANAGAPSRSLTIIVGETVSLPGVGPVASGTRLRLSSDEKKERRARRCGHPTVKPIALMRYLVRLITPPGGTVLDPFTGSGTTGIAAVLEGFHFVGCELDPAYVAIAQARIEHWRTSAGRAA